MLFFICKISASFYFYSYFSILLPPPTQAYDTYDNPITHDGQTTVVFIENTVRTFQLVLDLDGSCKQYEENVGGGDGEESEWRMLSANRVYFGLLFLFHKFSNFTLIPPSVAGWPVLSMAQRQHLSMSPHRAHTMHTSTNTTRRRRMVLVWGVGGILVYFFGN